MKKTIKIVIIVTASFLLYHLLRTPYFGKLYNYFNEFVNFKVLNYFISYLLMGLPIFLSLFILHKPNNILESLGLKTDLLKGLIIALICTLPMLVGYSIVFEFNTKLTFTSIFTGAVFAGLFEELYFRGYLFGQIFRYSKLGFIPSIIFGAAFFATLHLYQSNDFSIIIGIFITTFLGAVMFAWAYVEWNNNLYVPIFLHLFMNLFWMMFSAGNNALGNFYANIFRIITIATFIIGTIIYKKRKNIPFILNKKSIWIKD